jgi:hypothetical protein
MRITRRSGPCHKAVTKPCQHGFNDNDNETNEQTMLNILSRTVQAARATSLRIASPYRKALRDIPPQLYEYWARTAHHEFQGIPRDAFFYVRAADALLTFFECVTRSNHACALPSKAADSVWHAWLRYSPASLDAFCERHFGQRIPHVDAGDMAGGMALPLARSLVTARRLDGLPLAGPGVPQLFATDRALRMPGGLAYDLRGGALVCSPIGRRGRPVGSGQVYPALTPHFLLAAGLIARADYEGWQQRCRPRDTGEVAGNAAELACDAVGNVASGDGGGGGSSCGGGCGGGGCGS